MPASAALMPGWFQAWWNAKTIKLERGRTVEAAAGGGGADSEDEDCIQIEQMT